MRRIAAALSLMAGLAVPASAEGRGGAELVLSGPGPDARPVGVAVALRCADDERLAGARLRLSGGAVRGVDPICGSAGRSTNLGLYAWSNRIAPAPPSSKAPPSSREGRAAAASTRRVVGSQALIISIGESGDGDDPVEAAAIPPDVGEVVDVVCAAGESARGLRFHQSSGRRGRALVGLELRCARDRAPEGEWRGLRPPPPKGKRTPVRVETRRIDCAPGESARAVLSSVGPRGVESVGLDCRADRGASGLAAAWARARRFVAGSEVYAEVSSPRWFDGAPVAMCARGDPAGACAERSADAYCRDALGFARAVGYVEGRRMPGAVAASGAHQGRARVFASIVCAL